MRSWIGLVFLVLLAACQSTEQRSERLYRFVDELNFGGPFDAHHRKAKTLARWDGPLRAKIVKGHTAEREAMVRRYLDQYRQLTGMSAELVGEDAEANVTLAFVADKDFLTNQEYVPCYVRLAWKGQKVSGGRIEISVADPEQTQRCIAHELMHTYGFRYHSGVVRSVLSPAHDQDTLSAWDELALKILYDPRVQPGLTREEAGPVFRQLIDEAVN